MSAAADGETPSSPMPAHQAGSAQEAGALLRATAERGAAYLEHLPQRRVGPTATPQELRAALALPLPDHPVDPATVVDDLATAAEPGLVGSAGPRYFGFVIGGALPAAVAADWLAAAWDQNAGIYALSPAASIAEEVASAWLVDVLGLPAGVSSAFVTGCQMAHVTCLAAARHHVLAALGWDVERDGLHGAPRVRVLAGEQRHATIDRALRYLGLGTNAIATVAADGQGRMDPDALTAALAAGDGPAIVCAQLGQLNTGAFDPVGELTDRAHAHGAWVHIDGAFGLWARASRRLRESTAGSERADSWATDAHKWLNVPYDSGLAFTRHPAAHAGALGTRASYMIISETGERDQVDWNPEFSRRARGFAVYAALRSLGRSGVEALVDRCCALARRFADALDAADGLEVCNDVVLNQVLVRVHGSDEATRATIERVQADGTCWLGGVDWQGRHVMRISVSGWSTTQDDVDRSVAAILRAASRSA